MTYKGILLSVLLAAIVGMSYGQNTVNPKIRQLQEICLQKKYKLSELGTKIAEKQKLIEDTFHDAALFLPELISSLNLDGEEKEDFIKKYVALLENFGSKLDHAISIKKDVKGFLIKELFNEKRKFPQDFDRAKFGVIRWIIERDLLKKLVENYEECLQELIEIDQELDLLLHQSAPL